MSEARATARPARRRLTACERLLERFLLPLIRGGKVQVGRPLGAAELSALQTQAEPVLEEVERARESSAAALWLYHVPLQWDEVSARLTVATHNLLFLDHPETERWTARATQLRSVAEFTRSVLEVPPPKSAAEAVARHTLVNRVFELQREDVVLETWLMVYSFRGQEPPANMRRLPRLRGVHESRTRIRWVADERLSELHEDLLGRLLRASPLTDLLTPLRARPAFDWTLIAEYLRWPLLCRLVCQRYLELGLEQLSRPLCSAFWELTKATPSPGQRQRVRRVLELLLYLCAAANLTTLEPTPEFRRDQDALAQLPTVIAAASACGFLPMDDAETPLRHLRRLVEGVLGATPTAAADAPTAAVNINQLAARLRAALE